MDSSVVRPIKTEDIETIQDWFREWDIAPPPEEIIPNNGYIIDDLVAGFLYVTDSSLGMLDLFISNPEAKGVDRQRALMVLTHTLLEKARDLDCRLIIATTMNESIKKLAIKYKFKYQGEHALFSREL